MLYVFNISLFFGCSIETAWENLREQLLTIFISYFQLVFISFQI